MTLEGQAIVQSCQPGQFVHLKVTTGQDPFLRRPFSIHKIDRNAGTFDLLYKVVGRGTAIMRETPAGTSFDTMGPLGSEFRIDDTFSHALVVAGGMGIAPVFFLIDALLGASKDVTLFWGARSSGEIFGLDAIRSRGVKVHTATEDGSDGVCGMVCDALDPILKKYRDDSTAGGFVCGPHGMLKAVQNQAMNTVFDWQASAEERMACGAGVCLGCAIPMRSGGFKMACTDGPVFDLKEILFDG